MNGCMGGYFTKLRDEDVFLSFKECRQQTSQEAAFLLKSSVFLGAELHISMQWAHLLDTWALDRTD